MIFEWTEKERSDLIHRGFRPGFMHDIKVGDIVNIPSISRFLPEEDLPEQYLVQRIIRTQHEDLINDDETIPHYVVVFIGVAADEMPYHKAYGHTYPCMILRRD